MLLGEYAAKDFLIEERIGADSGFEVFRGREIHTSEPVAIEVIAALPAQQLERFRRSADRLEELQPSDTVHYLAHGTTPEGEAFIVIEWLDEDTLGERFGRLSAIQEELRGPEIAPPRLASGLRMADRTSRWKNIRRVLLPLALLALTGAGVAAIFTLRRSPRLGASGPASQMAPRATASGAPTAHAASIGTTPAPSSARSARAPTAERVPGCPEDALGCAPVRAADLTRVDAFSLLPDALALAQSIRPYAQLAEVHAAGISAGLLDLSRSSTITFGMTSEISVEARGNLFTARTNPINFAWPVRLTRCDIKRAYSAAVYAGLPEAPPATLSFGGVNVEDRLYFTVDTKSGPSKVNVDSRTCVGTTISLGWGNPY